MQNSGIAIKELPANTVRWTTSCSKSS